MSYNPFSLEGKTVLVTGASSGIGQTTAIECSKMGAKVIITGRNEQRLKATYDALNPHVSNHVLFSADLATNEGIQKIVDEVEVLDGLVLCAGRGMTVPLQFATQEKVDSVFRLNFYSQIELLRMLYKKKKIKKESSIVLVCSIGGTRSFLPANGLYGASKSALNSIMKYAAVEFAPRKIRVNSVCPGMVETPLIHGGMFTQEDRETDMDKYPLKRYGKTTDVAYGIIYLLSDAASWITGHALVIDGGFTI